MNKYFWDIHISIDMIFSWVHFNSKVPRQMPDKNPDSSEEPAHGCEAKGGEHSWRLWMSFILERAISVTLFEILICCLTFLKYMVLLSTSLTTALQLLKLFPWRGELSPQVSDFISVHPIYPVCITFCLSITSVRHPLTIAFVRRTLHLSEELCICVGRVFHL